MRAHRLGSTAALVTVIGVLLAACGGSNSDPGSGGAASGAPKAQAGSPFAGKTLTVVVQPDWKPLMWKDDKGQETGYFYDLVNEVAKRLGAKVQPVNAEFTAIIPSLQSGKFDVGVGTDATVERQQAVDIVPFLRAGYRFLTRKDAKDIGSSLNDLCGLKVATLAGHSIVPPLEQQSKVCTDQGRKPITLLSFPTLAAAQLAVKSSRADATDAYTGEAGWMVKADPSMKITGPEINQNFSGFAVSKRTGHADAWAKAVNQLINDPSGIYRKTLEKYSVGEIAIDKSVVNPAK
ncbi:transporter substrate-binding domain-containing protein [Streptomyces sp. NBC_01764]|uniref:transporter substrate-binding domain-containing protein n=1 Tax=Streptomyces sp. NBC_01764 TaxID=2975935 RepID=UPI0022575DD2|nr:transporter substrate-binding domain-containing protein [Streptomyces sp. NBC_01764]MCX4409488.1 transporter substrate-binding domain-containing protein [Streptomyces sp. NBC_01764]